MPALQHVYVTAHGEWTVAPWQDERAQIGLRMSFALTGTKPTKGTPFTIYDGNGDVEFEPGTVSGTNGTLSQTWTARIGPSGSSENADDGWQIGIAEDMWTFLNAAKTYQSNKFKWTHVKISPILATGAYAATGSSVYDFTTAITGGGTADALPPEVALALSLRAPISGRTGRGRMYFPALTTSFVDSNGTADATFSAGVRDMVKTLVQNLNDDAGADIYSPVVMVTSAGKATAVRPSEVRVGNHFDSQRRRQDQAVETYSTVSL